MGKYTRAMRRARWFSENPSKAWGEKFFLLYSPVWIAAMALVQIGGWFKHWSDMHHLLWGVALAAPLFVVPLIFPGFADRGMPWWNTYWFRFNVWIAIFVFNGTYFFTHYFFDVLGMRYNFGTSWNFDATLVGRDSGAVPIGLYPLTQAYFVTYHTVMVVCLRRIRTAVPLSPIMLFGAIFGLSYVVAYAETFFMANERMKDLFWYVDLDRMLRLGSVFYACYFVVSLPMVYRLDEKMGESWPLSRVVFEALAASMLVFILLDLWAAIIGPL